MIKIAIVLLSGGLLAWPGTGAAELPYVRRPLDGVIVSGQPAIGDLEVLAEQGVTTVINLRRDGEFDEFDEAAHARRLGLDYVHIPLRNVSSVTARDAARLHEAISTAEGVVLLHCTVGWRAAGLLAIERYLHHGLEPEAALELAGRAHMSHATDDVRQWLARQAR